LGEVDEVGAQCQLDQPDGGPFDRRFETRLVALEGEPVPRGQRGPQWLPLDQLKPGAQMGHLGLGIIGSPSADNVSMEFRHVTGQERSGPVATGSIGDGQNGVSFGGEAECTACGARDVEERLGRRVPARRPEDPRADPISGDGVWIMENDVGHHFHGSSGALGIDRLSEPIDPGLEGQQAHHRPTLHRRSFVVGSGVWRLISVPARSAPGVLEEAGSDAGGPSMGDTQAQCQECDSSAVCSDQGHVFADSEHGNARVIAEWVITEQETIVENGRLHVRPCFVEPSGLVAPGEIWLECPGQGHELFGRSTSGDRGSCSGRGDQGP